jgi:hypothetical protein
MELFNKAKGLTKKVKSLLKTKEGLEALSYGVYYYRNKNETIESLAKERSKECVKCEKIEFDDFEKIKDNRIPEISGKMCGECFCSLPYLLRQTTKGCELKKWK